MVLHKVLWEPEFDIVIDSWVFCWEPWLCISMSLFDVWEPWSCISMSLFDFWEPRVKCALPCMAGSYHSNVMFMLSFQCFLSIILCQCSSAIYGFTRKSSSPIMIAIAFACLLASFLPSFLTHSLTHSVLLISPSFHEWVVGEILPLCVLSTMAPTLMRSSPRVFHYVTLISMHPPTP
jgi:hypothetical protein